MLTTESVFLNFENNVINFTSPPNDPHFQKQNKINMYNI